MWLCPDKFFNPHAVFLATAQLPMYAQVVCPRCDHHFDNPDGHIFYIKDSSGVDPPTSKTQENQVALQALGKEICRLDGLINHLHEEKAVLLRRANSLGASTRRLPPEILSTIFQYARPPINSDHGFMVRETHLARDHFQFVLGAVSSHWRQVVWSTPQLWTTLSMGPRPSVHVSNESLLCLYFQNSRDLPMTIELDLQALSSLLHRTPGVIHHLDCFRTTIFITKAERIRNLIVIGAPRQWIPFIGTHLVNCEALALRWPLGRETSHWDHCDTLSLNHLPHLHHLQLENLSILPTLSWSTITILELDRMELKNCIELFARCPNLVRFESRNTSDYHTGNLASRKPIVHKHLELLRWHDIEGPYTSAFLECARFTKLRKLTWTGEYGDLGLEHTATSSQSKFPAFLSDLPITFEVFEFAWFKVAFPQRNALLYFKDLFGSFDCLPQLRINIGGVDYSRRFLDMIGRPVTDWSDGARREIIIEPKDSGGPKFLSGLRSLMLDNRRRIILDTIVEMLEALETTTGGFRLELTEKVAWQVRTIERILGLLDRGFELEVVEEGVLLDFMTMSPSHYY